MHRRTAKILASTAAALATAGVLAVVAPTAAGAAPGAPAAPGSTPAAAQGGASCTVFTAPPSIVDGRISIDSSLGCTEQVPDALLSTVLEVQTNGETHPSGLNVGEHEQLNDVTSVGPLFYLADDYCDPTSDGSGIAPFRTRATVSVQFSDGTFGEATSYSPFVNLNCVVTSNVRP